MDRSQIKAKAYAVFQHDGKILVNEVREKDGSLIGFRIPGGHIEFGEKSFDAVQREIQEELNVPIENVTFFNTLENTFIYHDKPGHEVIFLYTVEFVDKALNSQKIIKAYEQGNDEHFDLFWIDPHDTPQRLPVFPDGLADLLENSKLKH